MATQLAPLKPLKNAYPANWNREKSAVAPQQQNLDRSSTNHGFSLFGDDSRARLRAYQSNTLYEFISALPEELSTEKIYQLVLEVIGVLYSAGAGSIWELNSAGTQMQRVSLLGNLRECPEAMNSQFSTLRPLHQGQSISISSRVELRNLQLPESLGSAHFFPIFKRGALSWIIQIYDTQLDSESIQVLQGFCRQLALPLENVLLRQQVRDHYHRLTAIANFSFEISGQMESLDLYDTILKNATAILGAVRGSLMIYDPAQDELAVKAASNPYSHSLEGVKVKPGEGIAGQVFQEGQSWLVKNIKTHSRCKESQGRQYRTSSFLSVPLLLKGRKLGVLNLTDKMDGGIFDEKDLQLLESIVSHAAVALERGENREAAETLKKISLTDPLTELYNRRFFQERLEEEVQRAERHGQSLSLIMVDIDDFKKLNDAFGHLEGDEVLKTVASDLRRTLRGIDLVSRYGGEEFAIILPMTNSAATRKAAERIRRKVAQRHSPTTEKNPGWPLSISLGVATFGPELQTGRALVAAADRALYQAKNSGKNRVVIHTPSRQKLVPVISNPVRVGMVV